MLILFMLKACLIYEPTACIDLPYPSNYLSEEQCRHAAVLNMPQFVAALQATHPEFQVKSFACVAIRKGQDT